VVSIGQAGLSIACRRGVPYVPGVRETEKDGRASHIALEDNR
jgi:hypothetical protein